MSKNDVQPSQDFNTGERNRPPHTDSIRWSRFRGRRNDVEQFRNVVVDGSANASLDVRLATQPMLDIIVEARVAP